MVILATIYTPVPVAPLRVPRNTDFALYYLCPLSPYTSLGSFHDYEHTGP
jgi:hypothetical protein